MIENRIDTSTSETARRERATRRGKRMVVNRASSFEEAEAWDLDFWQSCTPQERLSAFVQLRRDVELALAARSSDENAKR